MIPIHATTTADPRQLRWVVDADRLPARGTVRWAPSRLGELLHDGVLERVEVRSGDVLIMLSAGRSHLTGAWWLSTVPGIAILVTSLAFNLLGDGLRDALDPRLRRS